MGTKRHEDRRSRLGLIAIAFVVVGVSVLISACSSQPSCSTGLHPYKDKCLTNMAIQYIGCTEGRGISTTNEISAGVGGTLKVIADATLTVAMKRSQTENTPVALQIVKDCMEIAKTNSPPDDPEQAIAANYERQWQDLVVSQTPELTISRSSARVGETVTVTGSQFWANEKVDIRLHAATVAQVQADASGGFSVDITVPTGAPPPGFATSISATGHSSAKSADAPFQTAP
jgi:hypothetical protein